MKLRQIWWEWLNWCTFLRAVKLCEITASCISFYWRLFLCKSFNFNLNFKNGRQLKRPKKPNATHFSPGALRWDHIYSDPSIGMSMERRSPHRVSHSVFKTLPIIIVVWCTLCNVSSVKQGRVQTKKALSSCSLGGQFPVHWGSDHLPTSFSSFF